MAPVPTQRASLLLLPAPSLSSELSSLWPAYKSTFEALLPLLVPSDPNAIPRLDIALILSPSYPAPTSPRSVFFHPVQRLLAATYSLLCSVAAQKSIDLDFPGGIDARCFVLEPRLDQLHASSAGKQVISGPIVDTQTFVLARRPYSTIYSPEGEASESHLRALTNLWTSLASSHPLPSIVRLPAGPSIASASDSQHAVIQNDGPAPVHSAVIVGGTFDHIHPGHKLLLTLTVLAADPPSPISPGPRQVTIGITNEALLVNKKHASVLESWDRRQERTADFIDSILNFSPTPRDVVVSEIFDNPGPNGYVVRHTYAGELVVNYTSISDPYGPTIAEEKFTALIISGETRAGGKAVNDKRKEQGWRELEVLEVDVLDSDGQGGGNQKDSFDGKISSTEIRKRLAERVAGEPKI